MNARLFTLALVIASCYRATGDDYREPIVLTPELASAALDPALMCVSIYSDAQVRGWKGPSGELQGLPLDDPISGFHAGLYERVEGAQRSLCLAFRGSELKVNDWKTDLLQALGLPTEQYEFARQRAQTLKAYASRGGMSATLTGHSLGGGLAEFGAVCWRVPAFAFASAPLAVGSQHAAEATHPDALRAAPRYVTHFFIEGDRVPKSPALRGEHFGRIVDPEMEPPENLSGIESGKERLALLVLAGLDVHPYISRAISVRHMIDHVARHASANYVAALMAHTQSTADGLVLPGFWKSEGSFFNITSAATSFCLSANGTVELQNEISILGGRSYTLDHGRWSYVGGTLSVVIPNFATLEYQFVAQEPGKAVQWRRVAVRPDEEGFLRASTSDADSARAALLLLKAACGLMKSKVVTWFRSDHDLFSQNPP